MNLKTTESFKSHGTDNPSAAWKWKGTVLFYESQGIQHSEKIASFDFDGTLAKTSLFKHGADAWSVLYPTCVQKLTKLHEDGYKLVIFTNQAAIGKAKATKQKVIAEKKGRLMGFVNKVIKIACNEIHLGLGWVQVQEGGAELGYKSDQEERYSDNLTSSKMPMGKAATYPNIPQFLHVPLATITKQEQQVYLGVTGKPAPS